MELLPLALTLLDLDRPPTDFACERVDFASHGAEVRELVGESPDLDWEGALVVLSEYADCRKESTASILAVHVG